MQRLRQFIEIIKKLNMILSPKEKKQSILVFFCILLSSFLELLSVSAILPFVYVMLEPEKLLENEIVQKIIGFFNFRISSSYEMVYLVGAVIVFIFILRAAVMLWANYVRIRFENTIMKSISDQMMACYIGKPYEEAANVTSAEAVRGISASTTSVYYTLQSFFLLFANLLTILLLSVYLISVNSGMALALTMIGGLFVGLFLTITRKRIRKSGTEFNNSILLMNQYATETINGLKEITVLQKSLFFLERFRKITSKKKQAEQRYRYIQFYPNIIIQTIFVSVVILVACIMLQQGNAAESMIPSLAVFGYGAIKIIPAVSSISSSITSLLYYYDSFNDAYDNLISNKATKRNTDNSEKSTDQTALPFHKIIIHDLNWKYKNSPTTVLNGLNMEIRNGECVGIVGKSGAGKTTLVDILLGLLQPHTDGCVMADEIDIFQEPARWAHTVGYVPQNLFLMDDSIRNNVLFGEANNKENERKVWRALEQAQLKLFVETLPDGLDTIIGEGGSKLSGGQRQRIVLARALFNDPILLILDEATSALDNETEKAVMESINYLMGKKTMIIIAHRLSTIEHCDRVYEIAEGRAVLQDGRKQ